MAGRDLEGRHIAVTGANRGLGMALAQAFVAAGARVLVHARSAASAESAKAASGAELAVAGELLDASLGARMAAAAAEHMAPGIDTLILNAGVLGAKGPLDDSIDFPLFRHVMEVNVDAQVRLFAAFLPQLLAAHGRVVWMTSGVGRVGVPRYGAYSTSKHAVEGLNRLAHAENGARGLVSVAVAPGMVQTEMLRGAMEREDVSAFTEPAVAGAAFVRLVAALCARPELAGGSLNLEDF